MNTQEQSTTPSETKKSNLKKNVAISWGIMIVFMGIFNATGGGNTSNTNNTYVEQIAQSEAKENETLSLNYALTYVMPEGFREAYDLQNAAEIVLVNEVDQESIIGDIIPKEEFSMEEFFAAHASIFDDVEGTVAIEIINNVTTIDNKTITNVCHQVISLGQEFYYTISSIEFAETPNQYLGFTGAINTLEKNDEVLALFESIQPTSVTLDSTRTFKHIEDSIEVTLPENWKRYNNDDLHLYFKYDATKYMELIIEEAEPTLIKDDFFAETDEFLSTVPEMTLYLDETLSIDDRTITTKVYEVITDYSNYYEYFVYIEYENKNNPVLASLSIETLFMLEELEEELANIIASIKY